MSQYNNQGSPNPASSDEIDLREVFRAIGGFFSRIGRGIVNFVLAFRRTTIRYRILIIICAIVGGVIGGLYKQFSPDYYEARMVVDSRYFSHDLLVSISEELNKMAEEQTGQHLGKVLNVPVEAASQLKEIGVQPLMPVEEKANLRAYLQMIGKNVKDISVDQLDSLQQRLMLSANQYAINVEVYDYAALPQLQEGILSYLSTNQYITRRAKVERENLQMLKGNIEQDEQKLNQLKDLLAENFSKLTENTRTGSNNVIFGADGSTDPVNVYEQSLKLHNQKAKITRDLSLSDEMELVSGFTSYELPASLSLKESILLWMGIGIGTAYLVIILVSINNALNRYEQEKELERQAV